MSETRDHDALLRFRMAVADAYGDRLDRVFVVGGVLLAVLERMAKQPVGTDGWSGMNIAATDP